MTTLNTSLISVPKIYRNKRIYQRGGVFVSTIGGESTGDAYIAGNGITIAAGVISLDTNFIEVTPAQGVKLKYNNITELEVISGGIDIKNILKVGTINERVTDAGITIPCQLGVGTIPLAGFAGVFRSASTAAYVGNNLYVQDNRVLAANTGGGITFGGIYTDVDGYTSGGFIRIEKEDAVTGHYGYDLLIGNRIDGASPAAQIKIAASDGRVRINQSMDSLDTVFSSGFTGAGWKLLKTGSGESATYEFEVDSLRVRGSMTVYELILNQIRATNGSLWVSDAARIETSATGTTYDYDITVDTDGGNNSIPFAVNDLLRCQKFDGRNVKYYVLQVKTINAGAGTMGCDRVHGISTPTASDSLVRMGNTATSSRQNAIYLTASDTNNPYIEVLAGVNSGSASLAGFSKARLGNLTGITDATFGALGGYGLWSDNIYLTGSINANAGLIGGWKIDSDAIYSGTKKITDGYSTSGITFDALGAIHAENFYINSDGSIAARNIILETDPDATYNYSTKIEDYNIYENNVNAASSTQINMKGYQGGFTQYRRTYIGNGKNNSLLSLIGSNNELGGTIEVKCQQKVYGRLIYPVNSKTSTFTVSEDDPVTICTNTAAIIVYLNASPVDGESYIIKRAHTGAVTVNGNGTNIRNLTHNDVASMVYATQEGHAFIYNLSLDLWFIMFSCNI